MLKYKYSIIAHLDYTMVLGEFAKVLDSHMFIRGLSTSIATLTTVRKLVKEEENVILTHYMESFKDFKIGEMGRLIIDCLEYDGTIDELQDELNEINILEKF